MEPTVGVTTYPKAVELANKTRAVNNLIIVFIFNPPTLILFNLIYKLFENGTHLVTNKKNSREIFGFSSIEL